jgi:hypothetical protein
VVTDFGSASSRPLRLGGPTQRPEQEFLTEALISVGVSPDFVARRIWQAMQNEEFFIFTDRAAVPVIEDRHQRILQAFKTADEFRAQNKI